MRYLISLIKLLIIVTLFFFSCTDEENGSSKITGTIQNLDNNPVQGATITLLSKNISSTSDASGSFEIDPNAVVLRNEDNSYRGDVIDTLTITHNNYLSKRKFIYSYSDIISAIVWDNKFRLSNEVSDWIDQPEYFATFDTIQLYDLINGGATAYNAQGLIDGIFQLLKNSNFSCDIFFYNFGTSQKATAMFTVQSNSVSSKVLIPGYDESIVVGDEFIGGAIIYAHFDKFDLELSFSGYTDIELLKTDAEIFLQVYESKISNIHLKK